MTESRRFAYCIDAARCLYGNNMMIYVLRVVGLKDAWCKDRPTAAVHKMCNKSRLTISIPKLPKQLLQKSDPKHWRFDCNPNDAIQFLGHR
jgi:hypothetical protein